LIVLNIPSTLLLWVSMELASFDALAQAFDSGDDTGINAIKQ
jgi:hypothetical protein